MTDVSRTSFQTRRSFLQAGLAGAASLLFLPSRSFAAYEAAADADSNDVVLRCCIMSDVHITSAENCPSVERLTRAINFMYDYSEAQPYKKFDAFIGVGDLSNTGRHNEVRRFKSTLDAAIRPGTREIICMGNHEFIEGTVDFWREVYGVDPNTRYELNGYQFIMVGMETGMKEEGDYLYALDWLEKELDAATAVDPTKPVFVCQHFPIRETVYGSRGHDVWAASDMFELLQKYPKVVDFSGHTHLPINDPRCAWQGNFTAFGTGTLANLWHGGEGGILPERLADDGQNAQFYIMEVRRDNSIVLKLYDLMTNSFFDGVYVVAEPGNIEKYTYTDARFETAALPKWSEGAKVECYPESDVVAIDVPQAACPDVTVAYRVDLERKEKENWVDAGQTYFYSQYFKRNMPEKARGVLDMLEGETTYRGKVFAYNAFMKPSEQFLTFELTTPRDPGEPDDAHALHPRANFLDVRVVDGKPVNSPSDSRFTLNNKLETIGSPKIIAEPELDGTQVVEVSGNEFFKVCFDHGEYARLRRFTIDAKVRLEAGAAGPWDSLLSNTEGSGVALCLGEDAKTLEFWASINGEYKILRTPAVFGKYMDVCGTFNGKRLALYIDGKEVAAIDAHGALTCPATPTVQAFCFGADIAPGGAGSAKMHGRLARGRIYTWGLTAEQVASLAEEK